MKAFWRRLLTDCAVIAVAALAALNYTLFVFPNRFAPSGLNGLMTMVQYVFHFSMGYLSLLLNVPLALLAFRFVNRRLALRSLIYAVAFSLMLLVFQQLPIDRFAYETKNGTSTILGPMVAGIINGFCYCSTMRLGGTTGGTDFIAALIHKRVPELNFLKVTFAINVIVAVLSYFVYGYKLEPVILCIIYSYLTTTVSDTMLRSGKSAVRFEIVTDSSAEISQEIIHKLHHSTTLVHGTGMYSGQEHSVLICIVNRRQVVELQNIIRRYPGTFACMSQVSEVVGNFKHIQKNGQAKNNLFDTDPDKSV